MSAKTKVDRDEIKRLVVNSSNTNNLTNTKTVYSSKYSDDNYCTLQSLINEATTRANADNAFSTNISNLTTALTTLQNWKAAMTDADTDNIINTITEVIALFQNVPETTDIMALLNAKVSTSSIVDNLTSVFNNVPLSANQGRVLNNLISNLQNSSHSHSNINILNSIQEVFTTTQKNKLDSLFAPTSLSINSNLNSLSDGIYKLEAGTYYNVPNLNCGTDDSRVMIGWERLEQFSKTAPNGGYITQKMYIQHQRYTRNCVYTGITNIIYDWGKWRRLINCEDLIVPPPIPQGEDLTATKTDKEIKGNTYLTAEVNNDKDNQIKYTIELDDEDLVGCISWNITIGVDDAYNPNSGCQIVFQSNKGASITYSTTKYTDPAGEVNIQCIIYHLVFLPVGTYGRWVISNEIYYF